MLSRIQTVHELFRTLLECFGERIAIRHQRRNVGLEISQSLIEGGAIDHLRTVVCWKGRVMV